MKTWIDVPSGWLYGFPKEYDSEQDGEFREWLVREGYPQSELDRWGDKLWVRSWNDAQQRSERSE
jgi:hypothetical protein